MKIYLKIINKFQIDILIKIKIAQIKLIQNKFNQILREIKIKLIRFNNFSNFYILQFHLFKKKFL